MTLDVSRKRIERDKNRFQNADRIMTFKLGTI